MTEQNTKLNKEIALAREGAAAHYSIIIEAKDKEIERLREICKDQSSEQGIQLLQVFKNGTSMAGSQLSESPRATSDQGQQEKNGIKVTPMDQDMSVEKSDMKRTVSSTSGNVNLNIIQDLQQQIKELQEKLRFANETIALMEDKTPDSALQRTVEEIKKNDDSLLSDEKDISYDESNKSAKISKLVAQQSNPISNSTIQGLGALTDTPAEVLQLRLEDAEL